MTERNENENKLSQGLERLREELKSEKIDDATRQRLESLASRVENQLKKQRDEETHHNLLQELEEEIMRFEVAHPRLTAIFNDIMVALGNMGI